MYKNKLVSLSIVSILSINSLFAVGGAGLHIVTDQVSVSSVNESNFGRAGFDNPLGIGGYLYLDAIPFVELDLEIQIAGKDYAVDYYGAPLGDFAWARASYYFTVKKKIFGGGIPFLAKAKIHVGGGFNAHSYTPYASEEMMIDLVEDIGGSGGSFDKNPLVEGLIDFLEDNKKDASGIHLQAGIQFKLLMLDTHLFYRYNLTKDVYEGSDSFGSINIRVGVGI
ncbi:MAG: hypothetical protein V3S48_08160 [Candidatus Neomarinimicrobiota bacterium]